MWPHASHALFSSLLLLGIVFPIAAHSAKHGVRVSYDGRLSASGTQRALIRKDGEFRESEDPDPEDEPAEPAESKSEDVDAEVDSAENSEDSSTESPEPEVQSGYIEDTVENTIAKAQSFDFDKIIEDSKRHVHYTAATSPTGVGQSPLRHVWHIQGDGPPVADPQEDDIVKDQHHKAKAGAAVIAKFPSSFSAPQTYPDGCFAPRHAAEIGKDEKCPEACPLFAEDSASPQHCNFKCVNASDCGLDHTNTNLAQPVPDTARGFCRRCAVQECHRCNRASHADVCAECLRGFALENGACVYQVPVVGSLLKGSLYFVILFPIIYFVAWYASLAARPKVNVEEERKALQFRTQTKLCKPDLGEERGEERQLWPLKTNTLAVPVAGPGSVLFFRYQLFIMVWALVIAGLWVAFVSSTDGSLYALGTENPQSPRELCAVIHRGYEQQRSLMSTKAYFLATAYVTSFVLCIGFGILQQRAFHRLNMHATHADFIAYVDGLPPISGSENLEEILKTELQTALSQDVVGVSVGWDFAQHSDRILEILQEDVMALEPASKADGADEGAAPQSSARWKWFRGMDKLMLTQVLGIDLTDHSKIPAGPEALSAESISKSLVASPAALVVFKTESGRDAAVNSKKKISFRGSTLQVQALVAEPMGICWQNLAIPRKKKRERIWAAIKMILLASFAWSVFIYMPFAQYTSSFSYSNGDRPSVAVTMSLTIIVVLGNLVMYTTCAEAAGRVGFMLRDSQEGTYMVLYTFSILVNILLDAALTGSIAYRTAVAQRARTYGGTLIADLTRAQAIFESFEIQRQLGLAVFKYCWPAMFFIPFVGEAIGANCFTLHLARLVVSSFSHIKGFRAQQALKILVPMDSGRYADVLINITAAVLIFFLPGGYTLPLFIALALSHLFIICFDHYRVLRCVPSFCFCSSVVDDYGQMLLILPCALTLAAFVLKANCTVSSSFCVQDTSLGLSMLLAFTLHVAVHWFILQTIVPKLGNVKEHEPTKFTYDQVAGSIAPSWFNLNPAHCLRSKYFYKHPAPCTYFMQGKEHLLRKNEKSMSFYEDQRKVVKERYFPFALG